MPTNLIFAALVFVLAHRLISGSALRGSVVARLGERGFQIGFSLLSVALTAWLVAAYLATPLPPISTPPAIRAGMLLLSAIGCYFIVAGLTTKNPTIAGMGGQVERPNAVHGVIKITRHPFLFGVALICASHLAVRASLPDALFFGTLAFIALTGMHSIDRKRARSYGVSWQVFREATSVMPGLALFQRRQVLQWRDIGIVRPMLSICLFALALALHE